MIVLDTSVLIDALSGLKRSGPSLRNALAEGERILLPSLVLYEWLRGPRTPQELAAPGSTLSREVGDSVRDGRGDAQRRPVLRQESRAEPRDRFGDRLVCAGSRGGALDTESCRFPGCARPSTLYESINSEQGISVTAMTCKRYQLT